MLSECRNKSEADDTKTGLSRHGGHICHSS
jgi:hypothetical protein